MKNWKKISALLMTSALLLAGCGSKEEGSKETTAASGDKVVIKMSNLVSDNNFLNVGYQKFKEVVEKESNGNIEVQIYNNATLAQSDDMHYEMIQSGALQISSTPGYTIANAAKIPAFFIFDVPFLFENREEMYEIIDGEFGDKLKQDLENVSKSKVLTVIDLGAFGISNSKKPIEQPSDLKGLKIRTTASPLHSDSMTALGGNPTPMAYGEVFTGLQQGTIDGFQTTIPLIYGDKFYEVSKHLTLTNHVILPHVLQINKDFYEALSEENKKAIDKATEEYTRFARELAIQAENEAVEKLKAEGVKVVEPTPEQLEKFKEAVKPAIEKNIAQIGKENFEKVLGLLQKQ